MTEPLSDRYQETQDARKALGPLDAKIAWLVKCVTELMAAMKGIVWQSNLNNGNVKEVRDSCTELFDRVQALESLCKDQQALIGQQQVALESITTRMDRMAEWAKTKGKT